MDEADELLGAGRGSGGRGVAAQRGSGGRGVAAPRKKRKEAGLKREKRWTMLRLKEQVYQIVVF